MTSLIEVAQSEEEERRKGENSTGMEGDSVLFEDYVYFPRDREISTGRWSKFYLVVTPKVREGMDLIAFIITIT